VCTAASEGVPKVRIMHHGMHLKPAITVTLYMQHSLDLAIACTAWWGPLGCQVTRGPHPFR